MKNLEIIKDAAEEAFRTGDESQRKLLSAFWPDIFIADPYLKACKILDELPEPPLADRSNRDKVSADAFFRLTICIRAKNMINGKIWQPVYHGNERHYFPRWIKNKAGFRFSVTYYDYWDTLTFVGERLEYRMEALLLEGVKEFNMYYQDYLN